MVPHIIPGHITALYIFAVLNLMALFHITLVKADISILNGNNRTVEEILDIPARFGPGFPEGGLYGRIFYSPDHDGCQKLPKPQDTKTNWIALLRRYGCNFDDKVYNAQQSHYAAAIIFNNDSNQLIPMGADGKYAITIPSVFIGDGDAGLLRSRSDEECYVVIDNRIPFNYNLYLLPFAIVVGICFLLMLIFMVAKWVRDMRKRRRARLSREHLKKLPTKKFKKGDPYDMCAICLDEYEEGDKLRILPCAHAYHMKCVDPWLTKNKRNCPVCKRKVIPGDEDDSDSDMSDDENDSPSETTPLLTAQNVGQMGAHNSAFQTSGGVSDANSVHPEDIQTEDASDSDSEDVPSPSTSNIQVHSPFSGSSQQRQGGYGSLTRHQQQQQQRQAEQDEMDQNPEYRGAVGGVGVHIDDNHFSSDTAGEELRGIVSSDPEEEEDEEEKSLRFKIMSLFKKKKRGRRQRRDDTEDA